MRKLALVSQKELETSINLCLKMYPKSIMNDELSNSNKIILEQVASLLKIDFSEAAVFSTPGLSFKFVGQLTDTAGYISIGKRIQQKEVEITIGTETKKVQGISTEGLVKLEYWDQRIFLLANVIFLLDLHSGIASSAKPLNQSEKRLLEDTIKKEIIIAVNAFRIRDYCSYIFQEELPERAQLIEDFVETFLKEAIEYFKSFPEDGQELVFPVGYKTHALYLTLMRCPGDKVLFRIDNLMENNRHKKEDKKQFPFYLGLFALNNITDNSDIRDYLNMVSTVLDKEKAEAEKIIYDRKKGFEWKAELQSQIGLPAFDFQTVENCVWSSYSVGIRYRLWKLGGTEPSKIYDWLIIEASQFGFKDHSTAKLTIFEEIQKNRREIEKDIISQINMDDQYSSRKLMSEKFSEFKELSIKKYKSKLDIYYNGDSQFNSVAQEYAVDLEKKYISKTQIILETQTNTPQNIISSRLFVEDIYATIAGKRIQLIGDNGSGKSSFCRNLVEHYLDQKTYEFIIWIENGPDFADGLTLYELIKKFFKKVHHENGRKSKIDIKNFVATCKVNTLFILDGFSQVNKLFLNLNEARCPNYIVTSTVVDIHNKNQQVDYVLKLDGLGIDQAKAYIFDYRHKDLNNLNALSNANISQNQLILLAKTPLYLKAWCSTMANSSGLLDKHKDELPFVIMYQSIEAKLINLYKNNDNNFEDEVIEQVEILLEQLAYDLLLIGKEWIKKDDLMTDYFREKHFFIKKIQPCLVKFPFIQLKDGNYTFINIPTMHVLAIKYLKRKMREKDGYLMIATQFKKQDCHPILYEFLTMLIKILKIGRNKTNTAAFLKMLEDLPDDFLMLKKSIVEIEAANAFNDKNGLVKADKRINYFIDLASKSLNKLEVEVWVGYLKNMLEYAPLTTLNYYDELCDLLLKLKSSEETKIAIISIFETCLLNRDIIQQSYQIKIEALVKRLTDYLLRALEREDFSKHICHLAFVFIKLDLEKQSLIEKLQDKYNKADSSGKYNLMSLYFNLKKFDPMIDAWKIDDNYIELLINGQISGDQLVHLKIEIKKGLVSQLLDIAIDEIKQTNLSEYLKEDNRIEKIKKIFATLNTFPQDVLNGINYSQYIDKIKHAPIQELQVLYYHFYCKTVELEILINELNTVINILSIEIILTQLMVFYNKSSRLEKIIIRNVIENKIKYNQFFLVIFEKICESRELVMYFFWNYMIMLLNY